MPGAPGPRHRSVIVNNNKKSRTTTIQTGSRAQFGSFNFPNAPICVVGSRTIAERRGLPRPGCGYRIHISRVFCPKAYPGVVLAKNGDPYAVPAPSAAAYGSRLCGRHSASKTRVNALVAISAGTTKCRRAEKASPVAQTRGKAPSSRPSP
jgi:hypothetical protein